MEPFILRSNGERVPYRPAGTTYTLEELQGAVEGYIEIITLPTNLLMVLNEEGKLKGLPRNEMATLLVRVTQAVSAGDFVVGDVLICDAELLHDEEDEEDEEDAPPAEPSGAPGLEDLRLASLAVKVAAYEEVDRRYDRGVPVRVSAHPSGFPAVEVHCEEIALLTDILSLEEWWRMHQGERWGSP